MLCEYDASNIIISKHAYQRLKERNGWNRKSAERLINRIYLQGKRPADIKGYLRVWVNYKINASIEPDSEFVLYGNKLYIFSNCTLITVVSAPCRSTLLKAAS